ncbi:hypothetical protein [Vibrio phage vB_VibM_83AMN]|nr:hypothetical protein [Vibrio phage vB_VibM_83AMN]
MKVLKLLKSISLRKLKPVTDKCSKSEVALTKDKIVIFNSDGNVAVTIGKL